MMTIVCLCLCLIGFIHFSMANVKHFRSLTGRELDTLRFGKPLFQVLGIGFTMLGIWPAILEWETEIGLVVWCGLLHVAAVIVTLLFTYQPELLRACWKWCMLGGIIQRAITR